VDSVDLAAWLRLSLTPGVGNDTARKLLAAFGPPANVFSQSAIALRQVLPAAQVAALQREPDHFAAQLALTEDWLQGLPPRRIVVLGDADYPSSLLEIEDPPLMLYLLGTADLARLDAKTCIAMVGSRNPTPQGAANARQFAQAFAQAELCVVSGMALGVDAAAHEGALASGHAGGCCTLAVIGTGLDRVYPKSHVELAERIAQRGLLVSEFPLGTPPLAANFPRRNRLIAGLSRATLVVEAALRSGSLITARLAAEQGKDVFAIPGSIHSPLSRGCHALIKQGAKLVESAQDVLEEFPAEKARQPSAMAQDGEPQDSDESGWQRSLLRLLGYDPVSLDALQARCGMATPELQARLLELELVGQIARLPGGLFQRVGSG
jgi:DNA processing protein